MGWPTFVTLLLLLAYDRGLCIEIAHQDLTASKIEDVPLTFHVDSAKLSAATMMMAPGSPTEPRVKQAIDSAVSRVSQQSQGLFTGELRGPGIFVARNITLMGLVSEEATRILLDSSNASEIPALAIDGTPLSSSCPFEESKPCPPSKYRNINSYCNNVQNPLWGTSYTGYGRLLSAQYADGVDQVRKSSLGLELPSSMLVTNLVHAPERIAPGFLSSLAAVWGQFIHNDISYPVTFADLGVKSSCCSENASECLTIKTDSGSCAEYSRTASAPRRKCSMGPREQLNAATAFLDGSAIYGSTFEASSDLRTFDGGLLKTSPGDLLPIALSSPDCPVNQKCYLSGDGRINSHPAVIALHTLFLREHNRIAQELANTNPLWDDETIYQETRRIVVAIIQHITYKEFLPAILGQNLAENLKLTPKASGYIADYDIDAYPATFQAASSAALHFALTMLPPSIDIINTEGQIVGDKPINSLPSDSASLEEFMAGLVNTMSRRVSPHVADTLRKGKNGSDNVAEIIMRGRDHGLPGYTMWRQFCGLKTVANFSDLEDIMTQSSIELLSSAYKNVADIDLFTGALSETPLRGSVVGPTFGCIIAHQFSLLRKADRFWYENDVPPSSFTKEQLQEIRKVTLAGLICRNFESTTSVPINVMQERDAFLNSPISCSLIHNIDLSHWISDFPVLQVPDNLLELSFEKATKDVEMRRLEELKIFSNHLGADPKSAVGTAFAFSRPTKAAVHMTNVSLLLEYASAEFMKHLERPQFSRVKRQIRGGFNGQQRPIAQGLRNVDVTRFVPASSPPSVCRANEETLPCDHTTPFRTFSGWCNNLRNPTFGKSLITFNRLLPAAYDDGISRPRWRSVTGQPLPSPRLISIAIHQDVSNLHRRYTMLTMQFAQFIDHDITLTPTSRGLQDAILNCKDCDSPRTVHPECWPIAVPANDPFFPRVDTRTGRPFCISFTRTLPGQRQLGAREQVNQNTAFLDTSHIYGQTVCEAQRLRSFVGGRLNVTVSRFGGKDLLPLTNLQAECKSSTGLCFAAGDSRSAEQPALTTFHVAFLREHNRIAAVLQNLNRNWDDERLYQTARRIVNAQFQHIIYNEFLPRILGWNAVNLYGLNLVTEGYFDGYDSNCNAGIFNEFATAAYRFGHSLVRPLIPRVDANFREKQGILLRNGFFNSDPLLENQAVDEVIRGLFMTPMENLDQGVSNEVSNHLFETRNVPFSGLDLPSLNIQRGRDHGLRSYNEYRAACNLKRAINFEDLTREMTPEAINKLRQVYASVDDIDLWTGGLSEIPLQGGLVGPTFACVIGNQYRSLRRCDRFWYENNNQAGRFTEAQLAEIRKVTLSRILCENSDTIGEITRSVFDLPHNFLNPRVPCRSLPAMDLTPWRDQDQSCFVLGRSIPLGGSSLVSPCTSCTCTAEGPQCQSLRVNCQQLLNEVGRDAILADNVCRVQCAFLVNNAQVPAQQFRG